MKLRPPTILPALVGVALLVLPLAAQPPDGPRPGEPGMGPRGPGGPGGMMGQQQRKILKQFDKDKNGWLNKEERQAAREFLKKEREGGGRRGGMGGPRGGGGEPGKPGPHVSEADVQQFPDAKLYDLGVLRTVFFEFENADWEQELEDFHGTDVEVPATMTVDGKKYPNVGLHFRGMSSYMAVRAGSKRSLNVSMDLADSKQRLYGYKTLNLLNGHDDATFMNPVLYSHIARQYMPCPKANFAKVVINGESWGVYVNQQQFDKAFLNENYGSTKGNRWKVRGNPGADKGLEYFGDSVDAYKRRFDLKSGEDEKAWQALITLCKTLNQTPADKLEEALKPMLDIDSLLWFLALDCSLINCDGYWIRSSDYSIYRDGKGVFHILPSDINECFRPASGPGFGGNMMMRMPTPGELLPAFVQDMLNLTDAQKKDVAALQKDTDAKLEKILTAEQRTQLKGMRDGNMMMAGGRGPGGPGGGAGGPGGGPGGPGGGPGGGPVGGPGGGFRMGGPGMGGRPGGVDLDPLIGLDDSRKPLRSKIFAVPSLKKRYLQHVKTIAEDSLDWKKLGPVVAQSRKLIEKEVEADTRKLDSYADFARLTADQPPAAAGPGEQRRGPSQGMNLRAFADQRRKYLLENADVKKASN